METQASKAYRKSGLAVVGVYFLIYFACFYVSIKMHPQGLLLWSLAVVTVLPILVVIALTGRYLRTETDEYKREMAVRYMLWGLAGALSVTMLDGFLRIFGWKGQMFPFMGFWVFFVFLMAAKIFYKLSERVPAEA